MGPCTANARRPTVESRCRRTTISCCVADLSRCLPTTSVTGVQQSARYSGALPCQQLCMMTPSLYVTRSATSSQCRSSCKILVRPWWNFLVSLTTRAAAFIMLRHKMWNYAPHYLTIWRPLLVFAVRMRCSSCQSSLWGRQWERRVVQQLSPDYFQSPSPPYRRWKYTQNTYRESTL